MNLVSFSCSTHLTYITKISSMDATHYWPIPREYSIWNATVTALQFWTEDLKLHILSDAIARVYTAFFCSNSVQQSRNISEEVIFGHCDNLKRHFWMRPHTRRWRIWEWEWKLEYTHFPVKSTVPIPHLSKWELVFWSCYTTYHSASISSTLFSKTQQPQSCMPPSDVWQFLCWESFNK